MTLRQKVDTWVACVFFSDVRLQIPAPEPDTLQEARIGQGVLENSKQKTMVWAVVVVGCSRVFIDPVEATIRPSL